MGEPTFFFFVAMIGTIAGFASERLKASGRAAFALAMLPAMALWFSFGLS
jgi:hypothetical protein